MTDLSEIVRHPSSFRDPDGFIFQKGDEILRCIAADYLALFDQCQSSGFFQKLFDEGLLIPHVEVERGADFAIIRPEKVPFISYPYEWCFSQWKDAALLTLKLQKTALEYGFTLKDATAFNVQFYQGRPVFIDTLSFDPYTEGTAWAAYRQFCEHFLAPLALMALKDIRLGTLFRTWIQGVPLDLASQLLPWKARFNPYLYAHLYLHAATQKKLSDRPADAPARSAALMSKTGLIGILDSLESAVRSLHWKPEGTEWGDYYNNTNYTDTALEAKRQLVSSFVDAVEPAPRVVWDCGGNTGYFSRIASERGITTLSLDVDPAAVEQNYRQVRDTKEKSLLPLLQDLTNPSNACGWNQEERTSLVGRASADLAFALALVHHLVIGNNVPLVQVAEFFARLSPWLIIEFVPKEDSQVKRLLAHREDIFPDYIEEGFELAFSKYWNLVKKTPIEGTKRTLYLFSRQNVG